MSILAIFSRMLSFESFFAALFFQMFVPGDERDLARAIRDLHAEPALRDRLVSRAAVVNEPYRWPFQRRRYQEIVSTLVLGRASEPVGTTRAAGVEPRAEAGSSRIRRPRAANARPVRGRLDPDVAPAPAPPARRPHRHHAAGCRADGRVAVVRHASVPPGRRLPHRRVPLLEVALVRPAPRARLSYGRGRTRPHAGRRSVGRGMGGESAPGPG